MARTLPYLYGKTIFRGVDEPSGSYVGHLSPIGDALPETLWSLVALPETLWSLVEHLLWMERCPYGVSQHVVPLQWAQNVFSQGLIYWKWSVH